MTNALYEHPERYSESEIAADFLLSFLLFWSGKPWTFGDLVVCADSIGTGPEQLRAGRDLLGNLVLAWEEDGEEVWQLMERGSSLALVLGAAIPRTLHEIAVTRDRDVLAKRSFPRSFGSARTILAAALREGSRRLRYRWLRRRKGTALDLWTVLARFLPAGDR